MNRRGRSVHARCREGVRALTLVFSCALAAAASAQATDLIISEYVEGSGNNKYIELYNGTAGNINLGNYQLHLYSNGSPTVSTSTALSGMLASGATIVYKNASATIYGGAATSAPAVGFNGDDAIALYKISTTSYVDIFGNIGCDPGSQWTSASNRTQDRTLVRNANICAGVTVDPGNAPCDFPTLESQWTEYAQDDVSHLGSHTMTCGPTVNFAAASSSALENAGTATVTLNINPASGSAETVYVTIVGGTATYGGGNDYTTTPAPAANVIPVAVPAGFTSVTFTINLVDDAITEPDETIDFTITSATGSISLGSNLGHVFTITNDDVTPTINFSVLNITVLENAGAQIFTLSFLPTTHVSGSMTIQMTNGPGATYGPLPNDDYTTNPIGPGTFTLFFGPNAPTASFTVNVNDDALPESTETVTFTLISVPVGFAIGANNSATLVIGDNDSPPALLAPGDLAVVGVNANEGSCGGAIGEDRVSFFCFQEITYGTEIIISDNGYERCNAGQWGNSEGTVRMRRTGPAIPAGQVITFKILNTSGSGNIISMAPDAAWTCTSINTPTGNPNTSVALNAGGDQLFFMQGGTWSSGTSPNNNATYSGTLLFAFTTNPAFPWVASCGTDPTQRSNLPPGVECFSMSPTLASDFNKYIGPTTAATQRVWIDRIDAQANWNSYPDCGTYNSSGYNWLSAPILPITPGTMTHGLWSGGKNTDWFECKNWDDARIPDATTDVVISETAFNNCNVGLSPGIQPGGTAVCASLLQTTNTATVRLLNIRDNSTLTVGGLFRIQNTNGTNNLATTVFTNGTLNAGSIELAGQSPGAKRAELIAAAAGCAVNVSGDITIGAGSGLNIQGSPVVFGTLNLGGDFINIENAGLFLENNGLVNFNGSSDQYIQNSDPAELFGKLKVDKPGGDVYLTAPITIRNELDLTQGRIFSTPTEMLTLNLGATAMNASNASFVHGPVAKYGNTDFTFPIGKGTSYRPAALTGITGGGTLAFTAEYFNAAYPSLLHDGILHHVSACEHWQIDRSAGTPNAWVTLSWEDPESCGVTLLTDLRVAYWDGSMWVDRGNSAITGTTSAGTVTSGTIQSSFAQAANYWTLGSLSDANPLPIELLSFTAVPIGEHVDLRWSTASEQNNDHFTVERSADAVNYTPLLQVPGAGNSQGVLNYSNVDPSPLDGLSYYRLRQTDIDGTSVVSDAVPVFFSNNKGLPLQVLYGNDGLFVLHDFAPGSTLEVMDLTGRVVGSTGITGQGLVKVPLDRLAHGVYLLRMTDGLRMESTRVAY